MRDNLKFRRDLPGWAHASGASVVRGLVDDSDSIILFDNMTQYQNKELLEHHDKVTGHLRRAGAGRALLFCFVAAQCPSRPKWDNPGLPGKKESVSGHPELRCVKTRRIGSRSNVYTNVSQPLRSLPALGYEPAVCRASLSVSV